ncbi:MAG: NTP transferase domain-containing protein [Synergistaceae bacterium]|jgi:CTP:molybdopterin cytidylyltransferase MocA|nr:NTP transferase domain-containing protein [Synergistaceae bacterium]
MKKNGCCKIAGLVLAAGSAERMGECKALMPLPRDSALEVIVTRMRAAGVSSVTVVTGGYEETVRRESLRLDCDTAFNPAYRSGMFSSVLTGIRAIGDGTDAFFLLPVDVPLVKPPTYRAMIDAFIEGYDAPEVVYPTFSGERGHPPLIGREMTGRILAWGGEGGLRGLLALSEKSLDVPTADRAVLLDMDTQDDYRALLSYRMGEKIPDDGECEELLSIAGTPKKVTRHMKVVEGCAGRLADALSKSGVSAKIDRRLLRSACLLHDIAKGKKDHEARGAAWLRERGYSKVAGLVASHKDLGGKALKSSSISEAELLYLSDKITDGEVILTLKNRMLRMETRFAPGSEALAAATRKIKQASGIQKKIEKLTGRKLAELLADVGSQAGGEDYI